MHNACKNVSKATHIIELLRNEYDVLISTSNDESDKWGISIDYHKVRSKFATERYNEVDGDRRLSITEDNFKINFTNCWYYKLSAFWEIPGVQRGNRGL